MDWIWREVERRIQQEQLVGEDHQSRSWWRQGKTDQEISFGCIKLESPQSKNMFKQILRYVVLHLRRERSDLEHIQVFGLQAYRWYFKLEIVGRE